MSLPAPPLRTWRPMVLWTLGILLALGLTWFTATVTIPAYRTRQVVLDCDLQIAADAEEEVLEEIRCRS